MLDFMISVKMTCISTTLHAHTQNVLPMYISSTHVLFMKGKRC